MPDKKVFLRLKKEVFEKYLKDVRKTINSRIGKLSKNILTRRFK